MTDDLNRIFAQNEEYIKKLKERLKDKKVIIYGAGKFFRLLNSKGVFSDLNVIGICDKKYLQEDEAGQESGYNIISIENLASFRPDYIIAAVQKPLALINELQRLNFNVVPVIKISFLQKMEERLKKFSGRKNNTFVYIKLNGKKIYNPRIRNLKVKFYGSNNYVEIHEPIIVKEQTYISCTNNSKIIINSHNQYKKMKIYAGSNNTVEIGNNTTAEDVIISLQYEQGQKVTIGKNCMLSYGIFIRTYDGHTIYDTTTKQAINPPQDVKIGNHVWIASDCKILKGSIIPSNCVVGTSSIVTKAFDEQNCIIAGNPARVVKQNINWDRRNNKNFST